MEITPLPIPGLLLIKPKVFSDQRGHFMEFYHRKRACELGLTVEFVQDNESYSHRGSLRGLHFQAPPHAQGKLVRVAMGRVWDVVVDIRKGSPTYGNWYGVELSAQNFLQLYVPPGMAHGFAVLEEHTLFQYKCSQYYHRESEGGLLWNDPDIGIEWPLSDPVISEKDLQQPPFVAFESPFIYDS